MLWPCREASRLGGEHESLLSENPSRSPFFFSFRASFCWATSSRSLFFLPWRRPPYRCPTCFEETLRGEHLLPAVASPALKKTLRGEDLLPAAALPALKKLCVEKTSSQSRPRLRSFQTFLNSAWPAQPPPLHAAHPSSLVSIFFTLSLKLNALWFFLLLAVSSSL